MSANNDCKIIFNNKKLTIGNRTPIGNEGDIIHNISCVFIAYGKLGYVDWSVKKVPYNKKMSINNGTFGGDPLFGIKKSAYMVYYDSNNDVPINFERIVIENDECLIIKDELVIESDVLTHQSNTHIAYGKIEHDKFIFKRVPICGIMAINNGTFGRDPLPGIRKYSYLVNTMYEDKIINSLAILVSIKKINVIVGLCILLHYYIVDKKSIEAIYHIFRVMSSHYT